jgi:hypothetical protein
LFAWKPFRSTKAEIKLHTLLDLRGADPSLIHISYGKLHAVNALDLLTPEPAAIYTMDRATWTSTGSLYCTGWRLLRHARQVEHRSPAHLFGADRTIGRKTLSATRPSRCADSTAINATPSRIRFKDPATGKTLVFSTNLSAPPTTTISTLYKARWQVELFFKS